MSKRSISITTSSANRSHNHLPPPPAVVSGGQRIPGLLAVSGLDLRPQPPAHKSHKQSASYGSRRKPSRSQETIQASTSMPPSLHSQTVTSNSDFPILMNSPSGRLARARTQSRTLSGQFSNALSEEESKNDPFIDTALPFSRSNPEPKPVTTSPSTSPSFRRRNPKPKAKSKADRIQRSKERRKENKHSRRFLAEHVDEEKTIDSSTKDMTIDLEEPLQSDCSFSAPVPSTPTITPPPSANSTSGFPTTLGASAPISVPSAPHDASSRTQSRPCIANSTPSTPPRSTSIQPFTSFRIPSHSRTLSHPIQFHHFSTSAPSSPSGPLLYGTRYANSTFQHSPSPSTLPKPKFLDTVFMELDGGL